MKRQELVGMLCLLLTALIWGFAFVAQVQGMDSMSPMFFNATRFMLGALSLVPILLWQRGRGSSSTSEAADTAAVGAGDRLVQTSSPAIRLLANPIIISVICGIVLFHRQHFTAIWHPVR